MSVTPEESASPARRPSIAERIALLKSNSSASSSMTTSSSSNAIKTVVLPITRPQTETPIEAVHQTVKSSEDGDTSSPSKPARRMSISDRIAMLKNNSATTTKSEESTALLTEGIEAGNDVPRKTLIDDRIAAMKHAPLHKPSVAEKYLAVNADDQTTSPGPPTAPTRILPESIPDSQADPSTTQSPSLISTIAVESVKPMPAAEPVEQVKPTSSIAERIAAMKAKSAAAAVAPSKEESTSKTDVIPTKPATSIADRIAAMKSQSVVAEEVHPKSDSDAPKPKVSNNLKQLGAKIILPGLGPGGPRPMFSVKPKTEETSQHEEHHSHVASAKKTISSTGDDGSFQHLSLARPAISSEKRKKTSSVRIHKAWTPEDDELDDIEPVSGSATLESVTEN